MLILIRKINESVVIGEDVSIKILGVQGNQVRLGITAPEEISVHREEIKKKIDKEKGKRLTKGDV